jgi:hypothetical protein
MCRSRRIRSGRRAFDPQETLTFEHPAEHIDVVDLVVDDEDARVAKSG